MGEGIESYEVVLFGQTAATATAGSGLNVLEDTGATFADLTILPGDRVLNVTQGLESRVVKISTDTKITTGTFPDGEITWATSDAYVIFSEATGALKTSIDDGVGGAFTEAEQTAAGYSVGDVLDIAIYQLSNIAAVARGFPRRIRI